MRSREEITKRFETLTTEGTSQRLILEVLLDIRDKLETIESIMRRERR